MSGNNSNALLEGFYSVNVFVQDFVFTSSELKKKLLLEQGCTLGGRVAPRREACTVACPSLPVNPANPLPCNQSPSRGLW